MNLPRLLALCGLAFAGSLSVAAVPLDEPVATLHPGYPVQWIGHTGQVVHVSNHTANVWSFSYTPDGAVPPATGTALDSAYRPVFAADGKALVEKNRDYLTSEGFRVIRLSDQTTLGDLPGTFRHADGSPIVTAQGTFALGAPGNGIDLQVLTYSRGSDGVTLRTLAGTATSPARSLLAACDEWIARWGTESQIGNQVVVIHHLSDLAEIRRITVRWQDGMDGIAAGHGNHLYFRTRNDFRCLDITTGDIVPVLDMPTSWSRANQAIDAAADGFWFFAPEVMEVRRYRRTPAAGFELDFRGAIPRASSSWSAELNVSANLVHLTGEGKVRIYDTQASRPQLLPPGLPPLKESDATVPLPLTLDRVADRELSLRVRTTGGSATPGLDYVPLDQVVTFPAGTRTVTVPLAIKDDLVAEAFETIGIELLDADGLRLPGILSPGVVIAGSGLEWREFQFKDSAGAPLQNVTPRHVFTGVIAGPVDFSGNLHLWDRQTGNHRGVTEIPFGDSWTQPDVLETPLGLESVSHPGGITLYRVSFTNGSTLAKRTFAIPNTGSPATTLLGGGRMLVRTGGYGYSAPFTTRIYSFDGPADGVDFPIFDGFVPNFLETLSDGNRLAVSWREPDSFPRVPGFVNHLRWYRTDTMEIEGEIAVESAASLLALRDDLLVFQSDGITRAVDLETAAIRWSSEDLGNGGAVTGTHVFAEDGIWEIATGLKVSPPLHHDSRLPDSTPLATYLRSHGPGGIFGRISYSEVLPGGATGYFTRHYDIRTDRQRPGLEWLGKGLRLDEEQAVIPFKSSEAFASPFSVTLTQATQGRPTLYRPFAIPSSSFAVPGDRQVHLLPLTAPPETPLYGKSHPLVIRADIAGAQPLTRSLSVDRDDGTPRLPLHLTRALPAIDALNLPPFTARHSDGRLVLATGSTYPDVNPDGRVVVVDPATGAVLLDMHDPAPLYRRAFGLDALVQGDRLLVFCKHQPTGAAMVEVYELSSQRLLGSIADLSFNNTIALFMDATPTHFALSAASIAFWEKKSTVFVYRWSDLKPVVRKSGSKKGGLGFGVDLKPDRVFAGIWGAREQNDTGLFAQAVGAKLKLPKWPKFTGGQLIAGEPLFYLLDRAGMTRAYDPATFREVWSFQGPIHGASRGTTRDYAWIDQGTRGISLRDGATGAPLATSMLPPGPANRSYWNTAFGSPGLIFFGHDKGIRAVAPEDLGDFADTRRWRNLPPRLGSLEEDLDGTGQPDFAEYVVHRLPPGGSLGSVRIEGGQVVIAEGDAPPADLVSLAEVEVAPGWWYPVAWRDGASPWEKRDLPSGINDAAPLRVRHLPHPALGCFPPLLSWPPQPVAIGGDDANVLRALSDPGHLGIRTSSASFAGTGPESQPLRLTRGGSGWQVEYYRPVGEVDPAMLESSTDLTTWIAVGDDPTFTVLTEAAGSGIEKVILHVRASDTRRFFRLRR